MNPHTGMGLTPGQAKVLAVIKRWHSWRGLSPTLREISAETDFGLKIVHSHLCALQERGHIRRLFYRARSIELIDPPARFHFIPLSDLPIPVPA
jgi:SOS-response transcriptional repressor LexA